MFQKKWIILKMYHDDGFFNTTMLLRRGNLENLLDEFRKEGVDQFQCTDGIVVLDNTSREEISKPKGYDKIIPKAIVFIPYKTLKRNGVHGIVWGPTTFSKGLLDLHPQEETDEESE